MGTIVWFRKLFLIQMKSIKWIIVILCGYIRFNGLDTDYKNRKLLILLLLYLNFMLLFAHIFYNIEIYKSRTLASSLKRMCFSILFRSRMKRIHQTLLQSEYIYGKLGQCYLSVPFFPKREALNIINDLH